MTTTISDPFLQVQEIPIPYSREAEEAVLGAVLIDPGVYGELAAFLRADDFYIVRLRWIWESFERLDKSHTPIDILTVSDDLNNQGKLSDVGGPAYLTALLNQVPTILNATAYGRMIEQDSVRRRMIKAANVIAQAAYDASITVEDALTQANKSLGAAQERSVEGATRHVKSGLSELYDFAAERAKNPARVWGLSTGFPDWDNLTGGLHGGQVTIISAPPGAGKTTLASQVAKNIALSGAGGVVIYELEMTEQDLLVKMVASECGVSQYEINSGYIGEKWGALIGAIERLSESADMFIRDTPGLTTAQLRADLSMLCRKHNIKFVLVDYVNLLGDSDTRDEYQNAANKLRRLVNIAKEFNVALLTIQSMTKEGMDSLVPSLTSMSGKADLGFDAANVFFMAPDKDNKKVVNMLPGKLRFGNGDKKVFSIVWDQVLPKFNSLAEKGRPDDDRIDWANR